MPNVTIKDIAKAAGVTHPTVSKALNDMPGVSAETRQKILKLARQMNYSPNVAAKRLTNKKNRSIGFIWPRVEGLFFYHLCDSLSREAAKRNIEIIVSMADPVKALHTFRTHFIDFAFGWFFPDWMPDANFIKERELYEGEMLIIGGGRMEHTHQILIDRTRGIYEAVQYLNKIGHRRVAYIGENCQKSEGYLRGMLDMGMEYSPSNYILLKEEDYYTRIVSNQTKIKALFAQLWQCESRPTAVILDSQDTAFAFLNCIRDLQISIPEDLSVISYDDVPELSAYQVPLTTCGVDVEKMVCTLLDFYEDYCHGKFIDTSFCETLIPKLVIRQSTKAFVAR